MNDREPPPGRYAQPSRRRRAGVTAVVVALAAAFGAWVVWAALGAANPEVRATMIGFRVLDDDTVRVRVAVTADRDRSVACSLLARDRSAVTVGLGRVVLPAGPERRREATTDIRTRDRAVGATIADCRLGRNN